MKKYIPALAIAMLLGAAAIHAAAPPYIPVQGVLTDSTGTPIDTSVSAVFSLYTSEVGGTAIWTETQSVLVEDGLFTAYLGEVTTLNLTTFRDNADLWLGIRIASDPEMDRVYLGSNPFAGYAEYCGNVPAHTHAFTDITGSIPPSSLPAGTVIGAQACSGTQKVSSVNGSGNIVCTADVDTNTTYSTTCPSGQAVTALGSSGTVTCNAIGGTGDITGVTAGTGLTGGGLSGDVTLNADTTYLQRRVTGTCAAGSSIASISATGTVTCEVDDNSGGDITGVTAGTGLTGGGTTGTVTLNAVGTLLTTLTGISTGPYTDGSYVFFTSAYTPPVNAVAHVHTRCSVDANSAGQTLRLRGAYHYGTTDAEITPAWYTTVDTPAANISVTNGHYGYVNLTAGTAYTFGVHFNDAPTTTGTDTDYCHQLVTIFSR
jgi:hypothetical protein